MPCASSILYVAYHSICQATLSLYLFQADVKGELTHGQVSGRARRRPSARDGGIKANHLAFQLLRMGLVLSDHQDR
jgi:hypothetical protein